MYFESILQNLKHYSFKTFKKYCSPFMRILLIYLNIHLFILNCSVYCFDIVYFPILRQVTDNQKVQSMMAYLQFSSPISYLLRDEPFNFFKQSSTISLVLKNVGFLSCLEYEGYEKKAQSSFCHALIYSRT